MCRGVLPPLPATCVQDLLDTNFSLGLCCGGASSAAAMGSLFPAFRLAAAPSCAGSRVLCPGCLDWDLRLQAQEQETLVVTMGSAHLGALPLGAVGRRDFIQVCFFPPLYLF